MKMENLPRVLQGRIQIPMKLLNEELTDTMRNVAEIIINEDVVQIFPLLQSFQTVAV